MKAKLLQGHVLDRLRSLPDESVHCVVTSPPYWGLRDYGVEGQLGLEKTPQEYIAKMVEVFREVRRVLRSDGTCWVNMGDSYAGSWGAQSRGNTTGEPTSTLEGSSPLQARSIAAHRLGLTGTGRTPGLKPKDLVGIPWRFAFALQDDGWWLRQDIIWSKPNPMPESVTDRCTKAHEYIFLLTKSARYYYDRDAIRTPFSEETKRQSFDTMDYSRRDNYKTPVAGWATGSGSYSAIDHAKPKSHHGSKFTSGKTAATKPNVGDGERKDNPLGANRRSVWTIPTEGYPEAHFATFPTELVKPCILAGSPANGTVLDPFNGSGTTGVVALRHGRNYIGCELNPEYVAMSERRIREDRPLLNHVEVAP